MTGLPTRLLRLVAMFATAATLAACAGPGPNDVVARADSNADTAYDEGYGVLVDGEYTLPHVPARYTAGVNKRAFVQFNGEDAAGTIVVDPFAKFLYFVLEDGMAMRYPIAVGREGKGFRGTATVGRKADWPGWIPTANMLRTEPEIYEQFRAGIEGGLASPLGARALYLYRGKRDTYFRIHGTNDLASIGHNSSAGCIRLFNQDIIDLNDRVPNGSKVRVRTHEESEILEGEELAHRGDDMAPTITDIYGPQSDEIAARDELRKRKDT